MIESLEVLVPERSKNVVRRELGELPRVRFVSKWSSPENVRLFVARLRDLDRLGALDLLFEYERNELAPLPLVLLGLHRGKPVSSSPAMLQTLALLSKLTSAEALDPYVAPSREAARRLLLAHSRGAQRDLIASASLEGDTLLVWSCEPRLYRCPVSGIAALRDLTKKELRDFEVSASGSRLRWPSADIDVNLDAIRAVVDPGYRKKAEAQHRQEASRYAEAIKAVREKYDLRQADIPGLSERQVRRLEQGQTFPRAATVKKLAAAHRLSVAEYLEELAEQSTRGGKR